mmetsp:Transcript_6346/g.7012  ORF Transcript_6346/g.7012 Transcript_6346/m.7012 type:complete len:81 (+) Transcript_6346:287-529(+)
MRLIDAYGTYWICTCDGRKDCTAQNDGIVIPKGSPVRTPFITMFRIEKYFDDPDVFNLDRWMDATDERKAVLNAFLCWET